MWHLEQEFTPLVNDEAPVAFAEANLKVLLIGHPTTRRRHLGYEKDMAFIMLL